MSDINIRLRTSEDSKAVPLTSVPYGTDLDSIFSLLGAWGISTTYGEFDRSALSGQFVLDNGEAYFEVIVEVDVDG